MASPEIDYSEQAKILKALAHPARLHIIDMIRDNRPCVRALEEALGLAQSNISQHLSLLRHIGIVEAERDGNQVCYRIKNEQVIKLMDAMTD